MSVTRLALGGCDLVLHHEGLDLPLTQSPFNNSKGVAFNSGIAAKIELLPNFLPEPEYAEWRQAPFRIDTNSTWALKVIEKSNWPYRIAPSPSSGYEPRSLHVRASQDFTQIRIYQGAWRNEFPETWLFYPYEQCLMMHLLQFHGAAIFHASGIEVDGKGYLFLGDSGAGKSTISTLFEDELGEGRVFSDDRIIVRFIDGKWWMFGTPWHGTFARIHPGALEIGGMYFIEKTPRHVLEKLSAQDSVRRLLPITFGTWWLSERFPEHLKFIESIATQDQFPLCRLGFTPDRSVVNFVRKEI